MSDERSSIDSKHPTNLQDRTLKNVQKQAAADADVPIHRVKQWIRNRHLPAQRVGIGNAAPYLIKTDDWSSYKSLGYCGAWVRKGSPIGENN